MLTARENMDVIAAFENVGTYRGAAAMCDCSPKTVKRKVEAHRRSQLTAERKPREKPERNTEIARKVATDKIAETRGKMTAKRLLPIARAAGYKGSDRNFRRLVSEVRAAFKAEQGRHQRRPAVWVPGATLVIDWGTIEGTDLHVFCAVLAWARVRFIRFARDEKAVTTFGFLAECFEQLGGVTGNVLADRMGCLKAGTVANVVIPTAEYVRLATHYRFRPDFCHPADPESKGIVENLVGYAKKDFVIPDSNDLAVINGAAALWCDEVNGREHTETCAVPSQRLLIEREVLRPLPSLRPRIGHVELRKVDKLSTVRVGSARYSAPHQHVGKQVEVVAFDDQIRIYAADGELIAEHPQLAPGEASVLDEHYPKPRKPASRGPRAKTDNERDFLALGDIAEQFIRDGAAAGFATLGREIVEIVCELVPAHGEEAVVKALTRAVKFGRFRAADIRSILSIGPAPQEPAAPGADVVVELPAVEVRSFDAYRIENLA
jgi:transposase